MAWTPVDVLIGVALLGLGYVAHRLANLAQRYRRRAHRLEAQQEDMEVFAAAAVHDLRAPARTIRLSADLARRRMRAGQDASRLLDGIGEAAEHMDGIVTSLLDFSEASSAEPERVPVDVHELAKDACNDLQAIIALHGADVAVRGHASTVGDPALLRRAIQNLVQNAIKYGGAGPWVRIRLSESPGEASIKVVDRGPGIPPEDRERLLRPFERGTSDGQGTGLGLATVAKVVEVHNGRLDIRSEPGQGATFEMVLPRPLRLAGTLPDGSPVAELSRP